MPSTIVVGTQWGDEGKGKICDLLAEKTDLIVRYQGGDNAGHTVVNQDLTLKLHHIPSGILHSNVICVIGDGMVVNPRVLIKELENLESLGVSTKNLLISGNAHLIMPYHLILDREGEMRLGKSKIGTTRKGIGPAYADKATRLGIRVQDLLDLKIFREKLESALGEKNLILTRIYQLEPLDTNKILQEYAEYAEHLKSRIVDVSLLINKTLDEGKNVLFEGAQGTLLDIDHGTYPFVTSSSAAAGGACTGTGVGPLRIDKVIGVVKAYVTRVGSGPFPTEEKSEAGKIMREAGVEYGTTTGRARRCGWQDTVILRYSARINCLSSLALTKLDVLSRFNTLKICSAYEYEGKVYKDFPSHQSIFHKVRPIYEEMPGWKCDLSQIRKYKDLPEEAKQYIKRIEELVGIPFEIISVGPRKDQTIWVENT